MTESNELFCYNRDGILMQFIRYPGTEAIANHRLPVNRRNKSVLFMGHLVIETSAIRG